MAFIHLKNVSVEFPLFNTSSLSFKKNFIRVATGGRVLQDANHKVVVRSLSDVSLNIEHGDRVGLIGHNGAGKSTFLRTLAGIYEPNQGVIETEGKISSMLDLMYGIEAESTGYENIFMRGLMLGLTRQEIQQKTQEIADFSCLGDYLSMPVRTYSSGMMVRLAFSISACVQPDILLIDEIFGAGDADFLDKARQRMISLMNHSRIVVFASHSAELIEEFCNKVLVLNAGSVEYFGAIDHVPSQYTHLCKTKTKMNANEDCTSGH
ncbi:MAG: lipopolysaccharide transport system ATP-binding protein [Pseudomonadota bacterium]|nr:lipopolysaccharide transport system ATP-binding protein [Pseudomonadota bacterium]